MIKDNEIIDYKKLFIACIPVCCFIRLRQFRKGCGGSGYGKIQYRRYAGLPGSG